MKKTVTFKKYLNEKTYIGFGLINGIINAGIFYAMEKSHIDTATFGLSHIIGDMAFTTFLLGFLLTLIAVPLTIKDLKDNKFTVTSNDKKCSIVDLIPKAKFQASVVIGIITMLTITALSAIAGVAITSILPISVMEMMILKGIGCAIGGGIAGYIVVQISVFTFAGKEYLGS